MESSLFDLINPWAHLIDQWYALFMYILICRPLLPVLIYNADILQLRIKIKPYSDACYQNHMLTKPRSQKEKRERKKKRLLACKLQTGHNLLSLLVVQYRAVVSIKLDR